MKEKVTLTFWIQETIDSGRWKEMKVTRDFANVAITRRIYDRAYILEDEGNQHLEDQNKQSDED